MTEKKFAHHTQDQNLNSDTELLLTDISEWEGRDSDAHFSYVFLLLLDLVPNPIFPKIPGTPGFLALCRAIASS